jgi:MoxR-like ATPase
MVERGVSPRAVIAVVALAKACSFLQGRDFLIPEDIRDVFADVCCHRLVLKPQARARKEATMEILQEILNAVKAPSIL